MGLQLLVGAHDHFLRVAGYAIACRFTINHYV